MSDERTELALELRRHLAWQESDGTRVLLKEPGATTVSLAPKGGEGRGEGQLKC